MKTYACVRRAWIVSIICALAALPDARAGTYTFTRIAASPGEIGIPNAAPTLNNSGQVAFDGLAGTESRIVRGNGGALTTIAAQNTMAITPTLVGFTGGAYAINASGQVAFGAYNNAPGSGVYRGDGVTITALDDTTDPNVYPAINASGTVAFRTSTMTGAAIYFGSTSSLTLLSTAQAGTGHPFLAIGNPAINDAGTLAFFAQDPGPGQERIYTSTPAGVLTEVTSTTSGGWAPFGGVAGNLVISNSGAVVFEAMKQADGRQGVYLATPNGGGYDITTIADTTGAYAGFAFDALSGLSINSTNQVAFRASLDAGGFGIFTGPNPVADKVIAMGDKLDGKTVAGVNLGRFALNDTGEIAFFITFTDSTGGVYRATPFAPAVNWIDWTTVNIGSVFGTLQTSAGLIGVNYQGEFFAVRPLNDSAQFSYAGIYTPPITRGSDEILVQGGFGAHHRLAFTAPVSNVTMHWYSVGDPSTPVNLTFTKNGTSTPAPFTIASFGSEFEPHPVFERQGIDNNVLHGSEGSGTLVFAGPITTLEWDSDNSELYFSFEAGTSDIGPDTATLAPVLTTPADNALVGSFSEVEFTLPEAALAGSVQLTFDDGGTPRVLHLTDETPGTHSFQLNPADPTSLPGVSSGPPIPDGTYNVVLSYRDLAGNTAAEDGSANVVVDTLSPAGGSFTATPNSVPEGSPFTLSAPGWSDVHGPLTYVFFEFTPFGPPQADSTLDVTLSLGVHQVYVHVSDAAGNGTVVGPVSVEVTVGPPPDYGPVVQSTYLLRSDAAPIEPDHAQFNLLRPPMINGSGKLTFKGTVFPRDPSEFDPNPINGTNDLCIWADKGSVPLALIARESGSAPGTAGQFGNFSDPIMSNAGEVAFKATLKTGRLFPAVTSLNNEVIYSDAGGSLTPVARKGDLITTGFGTGSWRVFNGLGVVNGGVFGLGTLAGVTPGAELVVWAWQPGDLTPTVRLQKKAVLDFGAAGTRILNTIDFLTAKATVVGQGRSYSNGGPTAWVRSTFVGGGVILLKLTSTTDLFDTLSYGPKILPKSALPVSPAAADAAPGVTAAEYSAINSPATNSLGHIAFTGAFKTRRTPLPEITGVNDAALWSGASNSLALVAREGSSAPDVADAVFTSFGDPVLSDNDRVAFLAKMKVGLGGVTALNDQGLWAQTGDGLKLIAREGTTASFLPPGAVIASFVSVATHQRGGIFKAKLKVGVGGVTAKRDDILVVWRGLDGTATQVMRERQLIEVFPGHQRQLLTFDVINPAPSPVGGVGRSFNSSGQVMSYCTFLDGTTGFIGIDLDTK
jgi:hypothetical protein